MTSTANRFTGVRLVLASASLGLAACAEGPVAGPSPTAPATSDAASSDGIIHICKEGPAGTYTFTITADAGHVLVSSPFTLDAGQCIGVWEGTPVDPAVTITEIDLPDGVRLDRIEVYDGYATVDEANRSVTFMANIYHGGQATFFNAPDEETGAEGCTPGYWKNHPDAWTIAADTDFDAFFGVDFFAPDVTLQRAIGLEGGGVNALARHAPAAALNAINPGVDYPMTLEEVRQAVRDAFTGTADVEEVKDVFDANNNLGCPLS